MPDVPQSDTQPQILANSNFSIDMVETLFKYFDHYSVDDIVTVEVTDKGLWLQSPIGGRQFLGATEIIHLRPKI